MSKVRVGIIGAGYIGNLHATLLLSDDRVAIASVHDIVPERAEALARRVGGKSTDSVEELMDSVDAVYITTPNTRHAPLALAALDAGRHVFCEKPMSTGSGEARAVMERAADGGTVFQVGHNRRFAPVYAALKKMLSEEIEAHSAHVKMNRGELLNPAWVGRREITGGFLFETTIHMLDLMRHFFGDVESLVCVASSHEYGEPDDFSVLLKFISGTHATLASSADASWLFPFERIEVFCHHTTVVTREMESITRSQALNGVHLIETMHHLSREERWGYIQENQSFIDSILEGAPPEVDALDGFRSVELVEACYRSAATRRIQTLYPGDEP